MYYCKVEGMAGPAQSHKSIESATTEAKRLASINPGRYVRVLATVDVIPAIPKENARPKITLKKAS